MGDGARSVSAATDAHKGALNGDYRVAAFHAMTGSTGWFKLFANTTISEVMLKQDEVGIAVGVLSSAGEGASKEVLDLLEKNCLPNRI
jgi:hypothetical protein